MQHIKPYDLYDFSNFDVTIINKECINILLIQDPCIIFNTLLHTYISDKKSILFTKDILSHKSSMESDAFLEWLDTLHFNPFYNPLTFALDNRKRVPAGTQVLEQFDYVVPYPKIELFIKNVSLDVKINPKQTEKLLFDFSAEDAFIKPFIEKDLLLFKKSMELFELSKKHDYASLRTLIKHKPKVETFEEQNKMLHQHKYKGLVGQINANSIKGWVLHTDNEASVTLELYKNETLLCTVTANEPREDIKTLHHHPTGHCGFTITFSEEIFNKEDIIKLIVLPEHIALPLSPNVRKFLE